MSDLPPPTAPRDDGDTDRFVAPPTLLPTRELLFRFRRLVTIMAIAAAALAVLPLPSGVHVIVLLLAPVLVLVVAISDHERRRNRYLNRYVVWIWRFRRDRVLLLDAGDQAREPVRQGLQRAWLLLGLFVAVFAIGLLFAGASAGISEGLYG